MKTDINSTHVRQHGKYVALFAAIMIVASLIGGCVVMSVYPYYQAKDVSFDDALLGKWIPADATNASTAEELWTFEKLNEQTYKLTTVDHKTNHYDAVRFKLGSATFLDCVTRERSEVQTPNHILMRTEIVGSQLKMEAINYAWLCDQIEKNPRFIRHVVVTNEVGSEGGGGQAVLTADTVELQKFILKHLKTTNAWTEPLVMRR